MRVIAAATAKLGAGPQADGLEAQRQALDWQRRQLLAQATDRELIALEYGREYERLRHGSAAS